MCPALHWTSQTRTELVGMLHPQQSSMAQRPSNTRAVSYSIDYVTTTDSAGDDDSGGEETRPTQRKRAKSQSGSVGYDRRSSMSSPGSTTSEQSAAPSRRRPTYLLQKEERDELLEQLRVLEMKLELLQIKAGIDTRYNNKSVAGLKAERLRLEDNIQNNLLQLARFESLVIRQRQLTPVFPLAAYIHLPADTDRRRAILESVKDIKIRRAIEVGLNRLSVIDPFKPYKHEERRATPDGKCHFSYFEVQQFEGVRAKQVYDALLYFQTNLEISVSEKLGQITLREDTEDDEPTVFNHRIVTTGEIGGTEELNIVGFARFYDTYVPHKGAQFGVFTIDTVDQDDLYPYKPHERTRKEIHAAYTLSEYHKPKTQEVVVVLSTNVFTTQLPPQFPLPRVVWDKLIENLPRWMVVMNQFLRESVTAFAAS